MEFCPNCGAMMLPREGKLKCNSCEYEKDLSDNNEYTLDKEIKESDNVKMLGEVNDMRSTIKETCPECGHDEAYYELKQTRSADEAPTRIFTCAKCKHTWRAYHWGYFMKDSKEKEHRISNLKDMINNIKENPKEHIFDDIEEDSELIDYLNKENEEYEELEIDDEFIYHPGDEDNDAINLEENNIDENFMIKTPADTEENSEEELDDDEFDSDLGEEFVDEISEGLDTIFNAKINRTPVIGVISSILGLIFIVLAATTFQSRSDRIIDNVMSGENSFIVVIFLIIGLFLLIYGLYRVFGLKNPLSTITSSIDSIQNDDEDVEKTEDEDKNIIPKSNIPLDKESYKIGEFNFDELKNNLKKPTASKPKTSPIEENIDDIPPAREKPEEKKGLTPDEIDEIEYQKAVLDNESIDDIFAEVEDIEDIPIISIDSEEEKKSE